MATTRLCLVVLLASGDVRARETSRSVQGRLRGRCKGDFAGRCKRERGRCKRERGLGQVKRWSVQGV